MRRLFTGSVQSPDDPSPTGGGRAWRVTFGAAITVGVGYFLAELITNPSKRNIEALMGVIFIGLGIQASMLTLCAFAIFLLPYPMHTSVGSTSTLTIFAVAILTIARSRELPDSAVVQDKTANLWLGAFLLMVIVSAYQVPQAYSSEAITRYVGLLAAITIYFLTILLVRNVSNLVTVLKVYMLSAVTVGVIATLQTLFPHKTWLPPIFRFSEQMAGLESGARGDIRVYGSLPGISPFGEFVSTSIIIMFVLARRAPSIYERAFWVLGIITLLVGLAGSATRMGLIALIFGFGILLVIGPKAIPRWQIFNVLFVVFALFVLSYTFIAPLTAGMEARLSVLGTSDDSSQSRWGVMTQALEAIPNSPIFGHGIYTPPKTFRGGVGANIHSLYLTLPYLFGIPALVFFLIYITRIIMSGLRYVNDMRLSPALREYMLALVTVAMMTMFYEITGEFITHVQSSHFFWLRLGFLVAATGLCREIVATSSSESSPS